jgi:GGDEF domain-containing protein
LYEGANHDVLTGLANRRLLQEKFDAIGPRERGSKSAVLFIDLDGLSRPTIRSGTG